MDRFGERVPRRIVPAEEDGCGAEEGRWYEIELCAIHELIPNSALLDGSGWNRSRTAFGIRCLALGKFGKELRPNGIQYFLDTFDPIEVRRDWEPYPLVLGELATVQPDDAITGKAQEANPVDYSFWARHMNFINLQQRVR